VSQSAANAVTVSTMSAVASIPVFTARTSKSSATASICPSTSSTGRTCVLSTPRVFCAVTAVTALVAKVPQASIVLRSAWMPAPPPESLPAMVSVTGLSVGAGRRRSVMVVGTGVA